MSFFTIAKQGTGIFKEKGSKFLGFTFRVNSESEAKNLLDELRQKHPGACHVCYAFKLGADGAKYRASDDGEPSNSAGLPILGQIHSFGVTQVLVAVVRYYGGTKLGIGGLVQAYRASAKEALNDSGLVEQEVTISFRLSCAYEHLPRIMKEIKRQNIEIIDQKLDLNCQLTLRMSEEKASFWIEFFKVNSLRFDTM
jgi:uncharacterized YigZ family protein